MLNLSTGFRPKQHHFLINRTVLDCIKYYTDRNSTLRSLFWPQSGLLPLLKTLTPKLDPIAGKDNQDCLCTAKCHTRHTSEPDVICVHVCIELSTAAGGREKWGSQQAIGRTTKSPPSNLRTPGQHNTRVWLPGARITKVRHPESAQKTKHWAPLITALTATGHRTRHELWPQMMSTCGTC